MRQGLESTAKSLYLNWLLFWRARGFWLRVAVCLLIGAGLVANDDMGSYDLRLQIRGQKSASPQIVILDISEREWNALSNENRNVLRPLKEVISLNDSFFWNPNTWQKVLGSVLGGNPKAVGVVFFFGENIRLPWTDRGSLLNSPTYSIFQDPRIIWGADVDNNGRILVPVFAATYNTNVGLRGLRADDDGMVRRFTSSPVQIPNLAMRLAELAKPSLSSAHAMYQNPTLINYSGSLHSFSVVSLSDVLDGHTPPEFFKDKIVIIGSLSNQLEQMQTAFGRMSRTEILANVVDNIAGQKTVSRLPNLVYFLFLSLLMAAAIGILISYPQSVSLIFFVLAEMMWAAFSAWAFDEEYVWIPVIAPLIQLTLTYIVFLSYRLSQNEKRTWRLRQEQKYLQEIEQLKTNFVSMMSHDLKTPIAKIQAICDRLLATVQEHETLDDLKTLRKSSDDLHRYIQSILQVTKVEAKDFKINKEVTDINENIEAVLSRLRPLANEKSIRLEAKLEPMFSIEADTTLLQEVVHNLIENAIKYTPAGGLVTVTSEETDDQVRVSVEDTGPGIAAEEQAGIWGKFIRGRDQKDASRGTGLGLFLVKYFIELHGGRVFLSSQVGHGTKVGFTLPVALPAAAEAAGDS